MKFIKFDELSSTNDYLRRKLDAEEYDVIIAKKQTNGRGKRGRVWISNEGSALFSFTVEYKEELLNRITIFSSYIVYMVLKNFLNESNKDRLKFKWPNDIYYENKKICGILCEKVRNNIIIGIGININNTDFGIFKDKSISLFEITGNFEDVDEIIKDIVILFKEKIKTLNKDWEGIISLFNLNNYLKDKNIKIKIDGNFEEKMYKVSRIERNGKISILGKGDLNEKEFESIEFEIFQ
ncbi:MAG: biotin--[acetyl-CoA-carboxylase] ligase [Leptotrichiaceae bacterium]|nr:biotin--[acetyl-CoA-carboxylase] ligase [Leptotrichiaceae bacterium]MBP6281718.1 biotin--[acetyl-CoA-carboxylase] ligase [Leptotrichiaceae bacterium]MBP7100619.1 biotin--[acetyl-CoA-carboxylase] ligase [Leptotrichiaceae bacterium]MBP7739115.1 biotin--[acetyl-CoA-carboxylase] ligase [Leptotrichiaceae bacterium]MBP9629849.1 biotin--[acetyl-CoA-carboxylase] ligase [Leptotrichiaceae bacterium]